MFSICDADEIRVYDVVEPLEKAFVDEAVEELHLFRAVFQNVTDDELDHLLGHPEISPAWPHASERSWS